VDETRVRDGFQKMKQKLNDSTRFNKDFVTKKHGLKKTRPK